MFNDMVLIVNIRVQYCILCFYLVFVSFYLNLPLSHPISQVIFLSLSFSYFDI